MTNPSANEVHLDVPLTNVSVAFMQSQEGFVANQAFPIVPVMKQSDRYYVYDRADWNRNEMKKRAPGTESAGSGYRLSDDAYLCDVHALHRDIDNQTQANADEQFNLQSEAAEYLGLKSLINREVAFQSTYFKTGVWASDVDVQATPAFGSAALGATGSTPIAGIRAERRLQQLRTGIKPNSLIVAAQTWDKLMDNEDFLSRIIGGASTDRPASVTRALLAQMLEIDNILVADGLVNNAAETADGAEDNAFIMNEGMLLFYRPARASMRTPSAGYTFAWRGLTGQNVEGSAISRFDMKHLKSERVEIEDSFAHKVVSADMGTFINNTL